MKQNLSKQSATILSILLFTIAIMLSGNVLSAPGEKATVDQLNAAIAAEDAKAMAAISSAIAAEDTALKALISAQQTALTNALADITTLKAAIVPKKIGDHFGGGIVFYVDETGQHGLIASLSDQSPGIPWYNGVYKVVGATGDGIGAGATNTAIIVAAQMGDNQAGNFAAKVAADYRVQDDGTLACTGSADEICHGGWYLPSKHELNMLFHHSGVVGGVALFYWSSTEDGAYDAWNQSFDDGNQDRSPKVVPLRVRAVRTF